MLMITLTLLMMASLADAQWSSYPTVNTYIDNNLSGNGYKEIPDGSGGAFIVWNSVNSGYPNVYAQHLNSTGVAQWTAGGVVIAPNTLNQGVQSLSLDGSGGILVAYISNNSVYVQDVNSSGVSQWGSYGVLVHTAPSIENENLIKI